MLKPSCLRPVSQAGGRLKHKPDAEHAVDHEVDDIHQVVLARRGGIRRRQRRYGLCWAAGPRDRRASQRIVATARRPRTRDDQDQPRTPATGLTGPAATTTGFAGRRRNRSAGILRCPVYRRRPPPRAGAAAALEPAARPRQASHAPGWLPRVPQKAAPTPDSPPRPNHRRRAPTTPAAASRACWPAHPRPGSDLPGRGESVRPRRACQGSLRRRAGRSAGRNRRTGCEHGAKGTPNGWPIFVSWRRDRNRRGQGREIAAARGWGQQLF